jgi:lipoprotein signal peptidase
VRRLLLVTVAAVLAAADLVQAASEPVYGHPRSVAYVVLAAALVAALVALVPRVPSTWFAVVGGVATAGALGNGIAALAWRGGVPNPIVAGGVAFNIADVCTAAGALALVAGAAVLAVTRRDALSQAV